MIPARIVPTVIYSCACAIALTTSVTADEPDMDQQRAIRLIQELNGTFAIDSNRPERPIIQVDLSGTRITDRRLRALRGLTRLRELRLADTRINGDGLNHIRGCTELRYLDLAGAPIFDPALSNVASLSKLETLRLSSINITDDSLRYLTGLAKLRILELRCPMITGAAIQHLKQLTSLQHLDLAKTRIGKTEADELRRALPGVIIRR